MGKARKKSDAQKTVRQLLLYRPGISEWFETTEQLFNQVAAFYFSVIQTHELVLDLGNLDAQRVLEKLTHRTARNPNPPFPLDEIATQVPAYFRRAAINAALGSARSFYSNLKRWRKQKASFEAKGKKFSHRPPVPPRSWNKTTVFYQRMWKERVDGTIMLYLWNGQSWRWVRFRFAQGDHLPDGWTSGSPHVVRKGRHWWLHTPISKPIPKPQKAEQQVLNNPDLRICAVDLNLDNLAVCTIQTADGTPLATRFIKGGRELNGRRKRLLGQVARHRQQTGLIATGEQDNVRLWRKIRAIDEDVAHRVSRRIVEFAAEHGAAILVFEHLGKFKPQRGKYSRRANEKRSYWLRGRIVRYSRYKAWEYGMLTCRVNPHNTSRLCSKRLPGGARCGGRVMRYHPAHGMNDYQVGAPLVFCPICQRRDQADRSATRNIGFNFFSRYYSYPEKPQDDGYAIASKEVGAPLSHTMPYCGPESESRSGTTATIRQILRSSSGSGHAAEAQTTAHKRVVEVAAPL